MSVNCLQWSFNTPLRGLALKGVLNALSPDNQAVVCRTCNTDKGSLSLGRWLNRLRRAADPRASHVADFMRRAGMELPS